jgi:hypothetical protein
MPFDKGHALLIGVGTYANKSGWAVPTTVEDARAVAAVLGNPQFCGYPRAQVTLLSNEQATRQSILTALDKLASQASADSTLLLFYSGHGHYDAAGVYYLTTHDLQTDAGGKVVPGTSLSQKDLLDKVRAIKAKRMLVIFNACHSGEIEVLGNQPAPNLPHANIPDDTATALLGTGEGRIILTACRGQQYSFIGQNSQLTIFAEALVNGLQGKGILSNHGYISIFDLYNYVYDAVADAVADDNRVSPQTRQQYGGTQEPQLTIIKQVGPFAVALYKGAEALGEFDAQQSSIDEGKALRTVSRTEARERFVEQIQAGGDVFGGDKVGGDQVGRDKIGGNKVEASNVRGQVAGGNAAGGNIVSAGGDAAGDSMYNAGGDMKKVGNKETVLGDKINAKRSQGFINRPTGPVHQTFDNSHKEETNVDKSISIGGDNYGFAAIDSLFENVNNSINTAPNMDQSAKAELTKLMEQLKTELAKVPQERAADATTVAKRAQQAVEAATDSDPDPTIVEKSGDRLKQAAENIKNVAPTVISIATMIATAIRKFVIGV